VCLTFLGILLCVISETAAVAQSNEKDEKHVLMLFSSFSHETAWLDSMESPIRERVPVPITFYDGYIGDPEVDADSYRESVAETFRRRYAGIKLDLVITNGGQALEFARKYHNRIFPGVPIVFTRVSPRRLNGRTWPGMTGVAVSEGIWETIELALRLQPGTNAVAVIADRSGSDSYWFAAAHSELARHQEKVREIDIVGPPSRQMLEAVDALPPHTMALFLMMPQDSNQSTIGALDLLRFVGQRLPTYSIWPNLVLNGGGIGGLYQDAEKEDSQTIQIATRVLSGEHVENIPVVIYPDLKVTVDWRQLRRWHIPESALPAGAVILNRPPPLWERYRNYLIGGIVAIVVLMLVIIGLLWHRARIRKGEAALRESEQRFKVMADTTPALIWMCNARGQITYLNERWLSFTGREPQAGYGDSWNAFIHPDEVKNVQDTLSQALRDHRPFSNECRLRRSDGVYRWMLDVATPRVNGDGTFAGFVGSAIDITDQKLAQQALEKVSAQMIDAQEKERSRIARDLHDDICQRLALLSMEIEQAKRVSSDSPEATKEKLQEIRKHCSEITGDVQSLSHQLHSSKLELLGIEAAVRGFCKEFSRQHDVNVEFTGRNVPRHLPKEISLCLFRVAQEALQNALKYSGVNQFTVEILKLDDEIHLAVTDEGAGFDVEVARRKQGLGLMSMQERVHLVHGLLSVESKPGEGTQVLAVVPLDGRHLRDHSANETASTARMA
jgi:PAS domain S-box-containing protein